MARSIRLRRWQKLALDRFGSRSGPDFLAVATPGAGKTTFALTAARQNLAAHPERRIVVVAPTQHLKTQWADAAQAFDLHLEPRWSAADGRLPADLHGIVTTYAQVATSGAALRRPARDAFVILDEVHHAGDDRAWGDAICVAFDDAAVRLSLSGTPFRSDTQPIPFVRYDGDEAHADFEHGYGDALAERGVVRPIYFPRVRGQMEWIDADGLHAAASFEDALDPIAASQRLRTALSLEGEWLPDVLRRAHEQLLEVRRTHPEAGGLVIAIDQDHARGIAALLRGRHGVDVVVATSEDAAASAHITRFARGREPWIVAVRMVSEGVDIPRLRVGVYATTVTTELFFRQAVGRLVRYTRGLGAQRSYLFIPDDLRLRTHALRIADQRRHVLRRREDVGEERAPDLEAAPEEAREPQLSLFAAVSAEAVGAPALSAPTLPDDLEQEDDREEPDDDGLLLELAPAPRRGAPPSESGSTTLGPRQRRLALREANATRARELARVTGLSHAQVNAELNRRVGLRRITEATVEQLERRREQADRWLRTL